MKNVFKKKNVEGFRVPKHSRSEGVALIAEKHESYPSKVLVTCVHN